MGMMHHFRHLWMVIVILGIFIFATFLGYMIGTCTFNSHCAFMTAEHGFMTEFPPGGRLEPAR